jgi:hypothetical protein
MPMTLVGFAIKLAVMGRTRVIPSGRRYAPGFLRVPFAIRVVPANDFIGLVPTWNASGSEGEAGTGKQDNKRSDGEEVLHRVNLTRQRLFCAAHDGTGIVRGFPRIAPNCHWWASYSPASGSTNDPLASVMAHRLRTARQGRPLRQDFSGIAALTKR